MMNTTYTRDRRESIEGAGENVLLKNHLGETWIQVSLSILNQYKSVGALDYKPKPSCFHGGPTKPSIYYIPKWHSEGSGDQRARARQIKFRE